MRLRMVRTEPLSWLQMPAVMCMWPESAVGMPLTLGFTVTDRVAHSLILVSAETNANIKTLQNTDVIDLSALPTTLFINFLKGACYRHYYLFFVRYCKISTLEKPYRLRPLPNTTLILPTHNAVFIQEPQDTVTHGNINRPL